MSEIRVAIIGIGNCASSLAQGIHYYRDAKEDENVPGLMHVKVGPYHIRDIKVVAAFDVDSNKVGRDVADAIWVEPNNTIKFSDVPETGVIVQRGPTMDGFAKYYRETVQESDAEVVDVAAVLRESQADILINYLPVGSEAATKWYMMQALDAGCAVVNCMPVFIARNEEWRAKFEAAGVPIVGDDIKAQFGATITHRALAKLMSDRGLKLERTSQLNVGGNMDFKNMLEKERLESKRISKTDAVVSQLNHDIEPDNVYIGPSDYVPFLDDRKWCYLYLEGTEFGDVPVRVELKLEVWDSPNSAGVAIDAIRCCKIALDRGIGGAIYAPSAYFMKSPPAQYSDADAREMLEAFIEGR
jgi:myo-inositol-1-phosphate synthase